MEYTHGSLFTGRGGFDEGAEQAGFKTIWNCEVNEWCCNYLKNNYPDAKQYKDVRDVSNVRTPTVISSGFPCQDTSTAQWKGATGIYGERTGLFYETCRVANECRPEYLLLENSPMLLVRGFHEVLSALASIGYDAEWQCFKATDFGYPHERKRLYVIAYPMRKRLEGIFRPPETIALSQSWSPTETFLRCTSQRVNGYRDITAIQRGDVVPGIEREIHSVGNAVMPVISEYLFRCIKMDIEK